MFINIRLTNYSRTLHSTEHCEQFSKKTVLLYLSVNTNLVQTLWCQLKDF